MEYDKEFEKHLVSVEKNYYDSYLVEFFEKRLPRNLDSITVDWKSVKTVKKANKKPSLKLHYPL